ncbi:beta/gamma crystallin-related protein, partial [Brevundimonas sp.]|uniref:beta/gamma crystallin-related protein n=1 Tax=Brevundimonas sp. TaxID=1871086 RepID=UPI001A23E765
GGGWGGNNGGGNNGGGWGGGNNGRDSVTVYRDANFRGQSQTFSGEIYNLGNSGFNDAISSMQFRGTWEACTDSNFRGQCQQFDGSVSNLDRWGLNDRISSIRPVRRGGGGW